MYNKKARNLLKRDCLSFIVNNDNFHWTYYVAKPSERALYHYDSLLRKKAKDFTPWSSAILKYIRDDANYNNYIMHPHTYKNITEWKVVSMRTPKQTNGNDCGLYSILFQLYVSQNLTIDFKQCNIEEFRKMIIHALYINYFPDPRISMGSLIIYTDGWKKETSSSYDSNNDSSGKVIKSGSSVPIYVDSPSPPQKVVKQHKANIAVVDVLEQVKLLDRKSLNSVENGGMIVFDAKDSAELKLRLQLLERLLLAMDEQPKTSLDTFS